MGESENKALSDEMRSWGEQLCWMVLAMTPVVWWLQGESVSNDQYAIRVTLLVLSAFGGITFRIATFIRNRFAAQIEDQRASEVDTEPSS